MENCNCCNEVVKEIEILDDFLKKPLENCTTCDHIQLQQIPTQAELTKYYENQYSNNRSPGARYHNTMKLRAIAQKDYLKKHLDLSKLQDSIDYGCGYGALVDLLKKEGLPIKGLEYDDKCIAHCKANNIPIEKISAEADLLKYKKTDLVLMSHVLEHIRDLRTFLPIIKKQTKYLFIEVPHYDLTIPNQWVRQLGHINFFNKKSLNALFENFDCEVIDITRCGPSMNFQWSKTMQQYKMLRSAFPFFRPTDSFNGNYTNPNAKGIWLRALIKTN